MKVLQTRYAIYIDNGSNSGWAYHYITPTANANEGSVTIDLNAHVDYYQFKIAGGFVAVQKNQVSLCVELHEHD